MINKLFQFEIRDSLESVKENGNNKLKNAYIWKDELSANSFLFYNGRGNKIVVRYHKLNLKLKILIAYLIFLGMVSIPVVISSFLDGYYSRIGILLFMVLGGLALILIDRSRNKKRIKKKFQFNELV